MKVSSELHFRGAVVFCKVRAKVSQHYRRYDTERRAWCGTPYSPRVGGWGESSTDRKLHNEKAASVRVYIFRAVELIRISLDLLKNAGASNVTAFRAGSFAVNRDTYRALSFNRIFIDSSLNIEHPDSGKDMRGCYDFVRPSMIEDVFVLPMTVFKDGYGSCAPPKLAQRDIWNWRNF